MEKTKKVFPSLQECVESALEINNTPDAIGDGIDKCFNENILPIINKMDTHLVILRSIHENVNPGRKPDRFQVLRAYDPQSVRAFIYMMMSQYKQRTIRDNVLFEDGSDDGDYSEPESEPELKQLSLWFLRFGSRTVQFSGVGPSPNLRFEANLAT